MKFDPHIHSKYSGDARSSPEDILKQAIKVGMDVIAISDHDNIKGSKTAIELSKKMENIEVVPSIEITTEKGHLLGLGIEETVEKNLHPEEAIEKVHDLNGLAIVPHPFTFYRHGLFTKANGEKLKVDGIEIKNARYIIGYANFKSKKYGEKNNLPGLGASDSHFIESIGNCYSEVECEDVEDLFKAIKKNKVKAKGKRTSNYLIGKEFINKKIRRIY